MTDKEYQAQRIYELLKSMDMSGYDAKEHGDVEKNVAEYLANNGVSMDPVETIKFKNRAHLAKLISDALVAYLTYLADCDEAGLIDHRKRTAFVTQYLEDHARDGDAV